MCLDARPAEGRTVPRSDELNLTNEHDDRSLPTQSRLKQCSRLARKHERERSGRSLAEGEDLIAAAELAGWQAVEGYRVAGSGLGGRELHRCGGGCAGGRVDAGFGHARDRRVRAALGHGAEGPLCVYLHGVGDPGNVGTVLRSAKAFGASSVALGPGCADPHAPKAVRASMGAIFDVEIARVESIASCRASGWRCVAARRADAARARRAPRVAVTLLVGAEREGLPEEIVAACERVAHIPIEAESLNAAMAATVALYEMTRQGAGGITIGSRRNDRADRATAGAGRGRDRQG